MAFDRDLDRQLDSDMEGGASEVQNLTARVSLLIAPAMIDTLDRWGKCDEAGNTRV